MLQFLDVAALDADNLELSKLGQDDISQHALIVLCGAGALMNLRVALKVVTREVVHGWGGVAPPLLGQRVAATTNQLAQLHGLRTSCASGQFWMAPNRKSALAPVDPVRQDERDRFGRGDSDTEAPDLAVIDDPISGPRSLQVFDASLGNNDIHGRVPCPHHVHIRWRPTVVHCRTLSEGRR